MWPILFCSVVAVAIVAERVWTLRDSRVLPPELLDRVWQIVESKQVNDKVLAVLEQNSPMGRLLAVGLRHHNRPRYVLRERMEDAGRHVVHELERFLNTLGTIAGIAPLLGLLGTVTGIIKSFNAISVGGMGDPRLLSTGISEALVCTAAGLCVAIPALIGYRLLRGRVDRLVVQMEKDATRFADALDVRSSTRKGA
jgi:biopolymer transport protein ExbB